MKHWADFGFKVENTSDGSPTLRLLHSSSKEHLDGESMHHSGGAWSETEQIYGRAIDFVYQQNQNLSKKIQFVVVGLGLGYIELLIADLAEKYQYPLHLIQIDSFESVTELQNHFIQWLNQKEITHEISTVYDSVVNFVGPQCRENLHRIYQLGHFRIHGALDPAQLDRLRSELQFSGLMYDAFSSKTNPELWDEDFLKSLIAAHDTELAVVATYASKGTLKRALKFHQFAMNEERGFQGKRNSTFAVWIKNK